MNNDYWLGIDLEKCKKLLETKSIQEVAVHFGVSKWMMYKYTSYYHIDVWKCKRKSKEIIRSKCKRCGNLFAKLHGDGYCHNCINVINRPKIENNETTDLGRSIINLYNDGKSFKEIAKLLGCSRSTVFFIIVILKVKKKD